jgi:hypothetical protein
MPASILGSSPRPVLPAVAWAAYKVIALRDSAPIGLDELQHLLLPTPMREEHERTDSVDAALALLVDCGLVRQSAAGVSVKPDLLPEPSADGFRRALRTALLAAKANTRMLASDEGPRELTKALAWFLCQPVSDPIEAYEGGPARATTAVSRLNSQFDDKNRQLILKSSNRWTPFLRWARYLGFIAPTPRSSGGYMPDPTRAVRDGLPLVAAQVGSASSITDFVSGLAKVLPVLDGGSYRTAVEGAMAAPPLSVGGDGMYSQSLSYALRRLEEEGSLALLQESDAPGTRSLSLTAADRYPVVRVELLGAPA